MYIIEAEKRKGKWEKLMPVEFKDLDEAEKVATDHFRKSGQNVRIVDERYRK